MLKTSPLWLKVLGLFLVAFLVARAWLLYTSLGLLEQDYRNQLAQRLHSMNVVFSVLLADRLASRDYSSASAALEALLRLKRVTYFQLYDADGRLVVQEGVGRGGVPSAFLDDPLGMPVVYASAGIDLAGRHYGTLRYGLSTEALSREKEQLVRKTVIHGIASFLAISLLLALSLRYWLRRELGGLQLASEAVADGRYDVSVPPASSSELAGLAQAFNRMLGAIKGQVDVLRQSEERFRTIFNGINEAIFIHDLETGAIVDVNRAVEEMYGYSREEVFALDVEALSSGQPPYTQKDALGWLSRAAHGIPQTFGWRAKRKDGSLFWAEVSMRRTTIGAEDRMVVAVRDIDQRRLVEAQLTRIMEVSPVAIYVVKLDPEGIHPPYVSFQNEGISHMVGYGLEEWGQPGFWESKIFPDDRERVLAEQETLFERGHLEHEYRFIHRDGSLVWVHDRLVLVRDEQGRAVEIVGTWLDITERVRSERDLQRINRFYSMLSLTNQAITRIRDEDRLFEEVCRIAVEEGGFVMAWIGMFNDTSEVVPVSHWGREEGYLEHLRRIGIFQLKGPTARAILANRPYVNDDTLTNLAMAPWRDEAIKRGYRSSAAFPILRGGKPVGAMTLYAVDPYGFTQEITRLFQELVGDVSFALDFIDQDRRRRQAEEELRLLNEQLESRVKERTHLLEVANKELEAFSYSVSHDLRAPLRSIDGFSQILVRKYGETLDEVGKDYLHRVQRASQRMGELIDDLLELSRVSRAGMKKGKIDLSLIAREVMDTLRQGAPGRELEAVIPDGLSAYADGRLMRVVLENLLGNAWKFTSRQEHGRIEFGCLSEGGKPVFFVRDNGAGFDMQYANKLFGAFQRLHKSEEFDGTGIGLATVQRIIHRHAGNVWAEGEVGKGACFFFTLENAQEER